MKPQSLYPRPFALLALGFILCTILGTVSHELGHIAAAKYFGFETHLSYGSMAYKIPEQDEFRARYERNKKYIEADEDSPEKETFIKYRESLTQKHRDEAFLITLGGPVQTMLTGTIGFLILWFRRKRIFAKKYLNVGEWLAVLLAYFWSRQVFNFLMSLPALATGAHMGGDEPGLSAYLGLPQWGFGLATFIIGSALLLWVTFRLIPPKYRFTFIVAGLAGSAAGWFVWMHWLGPAMLP